jgi:hypothetical protein
MSEPNPAKLSLGEMSERATRIVQHLRTMQVRELEKGTGHGYRSAKEVGQAVGLPTAEARSLLSEMACVGLVRRMDFSNGLFWRSTDPLPWEPGGATYKQAALEREMWETPLTLIVQSFHTERGVVVSRDVMAYPAGLRARAEAHVARENSSSKSQCNSDYACGRHLGSHYVAPPRYRLIELLTTPVGRAMLEGNDRG